MDYKAGGKLLAFCHITGNAYAILVDNGGVHPFVASMYIEGAHEWVSGNYNETIDNGRAEFIRLIQNAMQHDVNEKEQRKDAGVKYCGDATTDWVRCAGRDYKSLGKG